MLLARFKNAGLDHPIISGETEARPTLISSSTLRTLRYLILGRFPFDCHVQLSGIDPNSHAERLTLRFAALDRGTAAFRAGKHKTIQDEIPIN